MILYEQYLVTVGKKKVILKGREIQLYKTKAAIYSSFSLPPVPWL